MDAAAVEVEAQALAHEIAGAVERVLDAAEAALRLTSGSGAQTHLQSILEACTIGDIANQRLARIGRLARGEEASVSSLLRGPGGGLDQASADALMAFD